MYRITKEYIKREDKKVDNDEFQKRTKKGRKVRKESKMKISESEGIGAISK